MTTDPALLKAINDLTAVVQNMQSQPTNQPQLTEEERIQQIIAASKRGEKRGWAGYLTSFFNPLAYFTNDKEADKDYLEKLAKEHYAKGDKITGDAISMMAPEREWSIKPLIRLALGATALAGLGFYFSGYEGNFLEFISEHTTSISNFISEQYNWAISGSLAESGLSSVFCAASNGISDAAQWVTKNISDPLIQAMGGHDLSQFAFYGLLTPIAMGLVSYGIGGWTGLAINSLILGAAVGTWNFTDLRLDRQDGALNTIAQFGDKWLGWSDGYRPNILPTVPAPTP